MPRTAPATLALLALALTGCSASAADVAAPDPTVTYTAEQGVPVVVPGAPGEAPTVVAPGQTGTRSNSQVYGDADVTFVRDMVVHHVQALEMAEIADERGENERVRRLAERISVGQGPEIAAMQAWLSAQGLPPADEDAGHSAHAGMAGMVTPEEMTRLRVEEGTAFDRLFLELMTRHHEGAVVMAETADLEAQHPLVLQMASDTGVTQSVEIRRMQELLASL